MSVLRCLVLVAAVCLGAFAAPTLSQLGPLPVNTTAIDISGLSSGGFFAVQFHVAFSALVESVGVIAGGPYYCAAGEYMHVSRCMDLPEMLNVNDMIAQAVAYSKSGDVDDTTNLNNDRVWLYSGKLDTLVNPGVMHKLQDFYTHFVAAADIASDYDQMSEHGFPTLNYGAMCEMLKSPFILKCNYDAAGKILKNAMGYLNDPVAPVTENVIQFDASGFGVNSNLLPIGYMYVPTACRNTSTSGVLCRLHVAFHGCEQSYEFIDTQYVVDTGYLGYAESNNIVMLFPQAAKNPEKENMNGCFDWWGITDENYATNKGPQMAAVKQMVDTIMGKAL